MGFWNNHSTTGNIHVINNVVEKYAEYIKPLCIAFIHYETAFDSVENSAAMIALKRQGIEEIYVKVLEYLVLDKESYAVIKLHKISDKIPIH